MILVYTNFDFLVNLTFETYFTYVILFPGVELDIKYHFKDKDVYSSYKMILCFFIAALATVIECGVINTIDQGMLHNFCYFKDKFFQLCIFFHEQISLPQQLLSCQEDESNIQIHT